MKVLLKGNLVRLSAVDHEELGKAYAKWNRDSELKRLSDSSAARLHSSRAGKAFFEKGIEKPSEAQHYFCIRAIADDRLLGDINLDVINNWASRNAFVGIGINNREDWGKGYGTEAMKLMLQFAFTEVNLYRVTLTVFEYNPRAIRSYEKAGFRHEGRLRGALLKDGKRWDVLYMGILHEDWKELNDDKRTAFNSTLNLRATQWADVHAVAKLIYDVCEADGDVTVASTPEELEHEWHSDKFNPESDSYVIETKDGRVIGYGEFYNEKDHAHLEADIYVHPRFKGLGLIDVLLKNIEERSREEMKLAAPGLRVFIRSTMDGKDEESKKTHENADYVPVRFHWRMEIKLDEAPPVPAWPAGIELRPFVREQHAQTVWMADNEAFRDHWGSHDSTFEEWSHRKFGKPDFDPTLWVIAWDGDEIAGFSQNRFRMGIGWVGTLGVRRPWRKKGLGLALLQHSFGEFYKRGMKTIGLGVDASNPTGATRLYQGAGMYIASEFITYDKVLRPGLELAE